MTNIDTRSTYDMVAHMPFPKLSTILIETGEDMLSNCGTDAKANATVRQYTKACWNIMMADDRTYENQKALEYKIATDIDYRTAFIDYACSFIYDVYNFGVDEFLKPSEKASKFALSQKTRDYIETGLLSVKNIKVKYEYRVGY